MVTAYAAPELRNFETFIVACSGGKDSTATALWALENLPRERLRFVFCDTGAEWPETYDYLSYIEGELDIEIERIKAGDRPLPPRVDGKKRVNVMANQAGGLYDLIRIRGRWPGAHCRFCTTYLKRWPMTLYARHECDRPVLLLGQRAQESKMRSKLPQFDSTGNKTGIPFYRPILDWTEREVWRYLAAHHILPNPVYNYATRCGCWCCIMARAAQVVNFCHLHPDIAQEAADLEQEIGHNWTSHHSITNLLRQAQAQMPLFEAQARFPEAELAQ